MDGRTNNLLLTSCSAPRTPLQNLHKFHRSSLSEKIWWAIASMLIPMTLYVLVRNNQLEVLCSGLTTSDANHVEVTRKEYLRQRNVLLFKRFKLWRTTEYICVANLAELLFVTYLLGSTVGFVYWVNSPAPEDDEIGIVRCSSVTIIKDHELFNFTRQGWISGKPETYKFWLSENAFLTLSELMVYDREEFELLAKSFLARKRRAEIKNWVHIVAGPKLFPVVYKVIEERLNTLQEIFTNSVHYLNKP